MKLYIEGVDDDTEEKEGVLPPLTEGEQCRLQEAPPGAALYPAAAPLYRGDPGKDPGGVRDRPSFHLRQHHEHPGRAEVRPARQEALFPGGCGDGGERPPGQPFYPVRGLQFHRQSGGRTGPDLPRRKAVEAPSPRILGAFQHAAEAEGGGGQQVRSDHRGNRRNLSRVRQAAGGEARQVRQILCLLRLPGVQVHPEDWKRKRPKRRNRSFPRKSATNAAAPC